MLESFLAQKPLFYDEIDYTRMPRVYKKIQNHFSFGKIIHLVGTNGKGTTGRFLATALSNLGKSVAHYTSPHILKFNERIWLNGNDVSDEILEVAHLKLLNILDEEDAQSLSYFEYTTFLAFVIFQDVEYIVLEAGLGGEYDATAVFPKTLTLVTPIDNDHEAFLGSTICQIATTKLNAIDKNAIVAKQHHLEVYTIAQKMDANIVFLKDILEKDDLQKIDIIAEEQDLAPYLKENLSLAIAALNFFSLSYQPSTFLNAKLFGRVTSLNSHIIIDVGHNVLAAKSILKTLQPKKYTVIYNSYNDKDYETILSILKPIINTVELISIDDLRIESEDKMKIILEKLNISYKKFLSIEKDRDYLVFGSFKVVEEFLKVYNG